MNNTSISVQIPDRFFCYRRGKRKSVTLEETLKNVERVCNYGDSDLIWGYFVLTNWFYDAVYNIKLDPVLTWCTAERN